MAATTTTSTTTLVWLLLLSWCAVAMKHGVRDGRLRAEVPQRDKLLVVVIGGLRWDYLELFADRSGRKFRGFEQFKKKGVQARFLKSVFPTEDFPTWRTITTGLYPGHHGIIGNEFFDPTAASQRMQWPNLDLNPPVQYFNHEDERATGEIRWWEKSKPIWATAREQGVNFSTLLWSRCDVEWFDTKTFRPAMCESVYAKDNSKTFYFLLESALIHFQKGISDAALVYESSLQEVAMQHGPLSKRTEQMLRHLDKNLSVILDRMKNSTMDKSVNLVIMSDHGMTYGATPWPEAHPRGRPVGVGKVTRLSLSRALQGVRSKVARVVGSGAYAMVWPREGARRERHTLEIVNWLKKKLRGCDVYNREQIPEHLHWVNNFNTPPILILAHNGTVLLRSQRGSRDEDWRGGYRGFETATAIMEQARQGISGYDPEEKDMRGVFMAMGPGFKDDGQTYDEIELVDVYNMFCHLLGITAEENDGVLDRIMAMLRNLSVVAAAPSAAALLALTALVSSAAQGSRRF